MKLRSLISFAPGLIWGCWLLILTGFGWSISPPKPPTGFHVTVWCSVGGLAFFIICAVIRWNDLRWSRLTVRNYSIIGLLELLQNGFFLTGALFLVESSPLIIPLMRVHTTYMILLVGWVLERLGLAKSEPITRRKIICAVMTVVGLILLALDKAQIGVNRIDTIGIVLVGFSTFLSSIQHFVQSRLSRNAGLRSIFPGTIVQVAFVAIVGLALLGIGGQITRIDSYTALYLMTAGVFVSGIAFLARFTAYSEVVGLSSFEMAIRQELEYVIQAITAVLFLGSDITWRNSLGSIFVFGSALAVKE